MTQSNGNGVVVEVREVRKHYGPVEALRGINFEIKKGEVFGLLGPNGAGKTTTLEILEGLRQADGGEVRVCGLDPFRQSRDLKQRIGAQLQATVLPDKIRVEEALRLYGGFYRRSVPVEKLLDQFGLSEKRRALYETLSGGQKQRLALALALVNDPELVLLDEPTVGLDAQVRREIYALVERLHAEGRTLLLTTHYIEEAERLCDRVAIVDHGLVAAIGTPRELINHSGQGAHLEVKLAQPVSVERLKQLEAVRECQETGGGYLIQADPIAKAIKALVLFLESEGNELVDLHIAQPSLEDVFVKMTGRKLSGEDSS
ncbi:MAG TPA: ABC transporter ATP-binding protein [Terriglobia bacterium]|nr:ABC transporter ATP-binding protein [Terriglobia bacterium]